jgi:RND family efflux transporter MFP subunit
MNALQLFALSAVTLLLTVATGCRHARDDHGSETEPSTAQITVWTDRYEVFADHAVPVAGEAVKLATHVTDLHTAEPLRAGPLRFVARQGAATVEREEAEPASPGLYSPRLTFPQPGDWQLTLLIPTDGTNTPVELGTLKVYADENAARQAEVPAPPEGLHLAKEQQWKIHLRTAPAARRPLVERVRLPARVQAKPGTRATVTAPVSGQLQTAPSLPLPEPGRRVEAGQLLALLKPNFSEAAARVAEALAEFTAAEAALTQAKAAYERTQKLAAEQAKSPRELQEAELALVSARARHAAAAGLLATFQPAAGNPSGTPLLMELRAPIAGVLNAIAAGPGDVVTAGQALFTVLDPETVWMEARVPEANVPALGAAADAAVELPGEPRRFLPFTGDGGGRLVALGLEVDATTRTVPLIYELPNPSGRFRVGQQVTLHVETANAQTALAIPYSALVEEGGWFVAYVQLAGETFEKRELRLGIRDGEWVEVRSGLSEGERVVTRGAYAIRLSTATGAIPAHGHAH